MTRDAAPPCGWLCTDCSHWNRDCAGCRQIHGKPFWASPDDVAVCPVYHCCVETQALEHCGLCAELPCTTFVAWRDPTMSDEAAAASLAERVATLRLRAKTPPSTTLDQT